MTKRDVYYGKKALINGQNAIIFKYKESVI